MEQIYGSEIVRIYSVDRIMAKILTSRLCILNHFDNVEEKALGTVFNNPFNCRGVTKER